MAAAASSPVPAAAAVAAPAAAASPAATLPVTQTHVDMDVNQLRAHVFSVVERFKLTPSICKRGADAEADLHSDGLLPRGVPDWSSIKRSRPGGAGGRQAAALLSSSKERALSPGDPSGRSKSRQTKTAGQAGRTYTSRFRGVHQTFPTRRWEAQFRRNGRPTSLGCFDKEEEAARAYDRMMLWLELHMTGAARGVTNFDMADYERDITWLSSISQDDLIESLRSEGRKQAQQRTLGAAAVTAGATTHASSAQPVGGSGGGGAAGGDDGVTAAAGGEDGTGVLESAAAAAAAVATAAADHHAASVCVADGGVVVDAADASMQHLVQLLATPTGAAHSGGGGGVDTPGHGAAVLGCGSLACGVSPGSLLMLPHDVGPLAGAVGSTLLGIGHGAVAAVQQLQAQLNSAAATGVAADADAAAVAAYQIGHDAAGGMLAAMGAAAAAEGETADPTDKEAAAAEAAAAAAAGNITHTATEEAAAPPGGSNAAAELADDDAAAAAGAAVGQS